MCRSVRRPSGDNLVGSKRRCSRLLVAAAALAITGWAATAGAQCPAAKMGFPATTTSGTGSAPANDTFINPVANKSYAYFTQNKSLFCIRNIAEDAQAAGTPCWASPWTDSATLSNFPSPVVLSVDANIMGNTNEYIFLTSQDGNLYKINANTGATVGSGVSTRRGNCAADQVIATPSIQMYRFSNTAFQHEMDLKGKTNVDLVIVGTHTMCGDSTHNRVIAFYSDTMTPKWTFNSNFSKKMDFITDGGPIDYTNNRIYIGTNLTASQNSLWALSTIDGYDGMAGPNPVWSGNAGSIQNRAQLAGSRLYVATTTGAIQAYDPSGDGAGNALPLWSTPGQMPGLVTRNIWFETRSGSFRGSFLALDSIGNLRAYHDGGAAATISWTQVANGGSKFTSMPAVFPSQNKAYVGKADGRILQIDLTHGAWGADAPVAAAPSTVGDPTVDAQASGATDIDTVIASAASGVVTSFSVNPVWSATPCNTGGQACTCAAGNSCKSAVCNTDPCMVLNCVGVNNITRIGHCAVNGAWAVDGTACDDGIACTCDCANANADGTCPATANIDKCYGGHCHGNPVCYSSCSCTSIGDPGCGTGNPTQPTASCCGIGGCVDLTSDPKNCGFCGNDCESGSCVKGVCRGEARCNFATATTLNGQAASLTGADAIVYDNSNLQNVNGTCNAFLSSYKTGVVSPIYEVSPTGTVTTIANSSGTDFTPLNGIAVAKQGNQVFAGLINNQALTLLPELAISVVPAAYARSGVMPAPAKTAGSVPFNDNHFDAGPVGPVFDTVTYDGATNTKRNAYYANYLADGDLYGLTYATAWTAAPLQKGGTNITFPSRVTAIAFGKRRSGDSSNGHRTLAVASGVRVQLVDLDSGNANTVCDGVNLVNSTNDCVDLSLWTPPAGHTEGAPVKILSLAVHPSSGDFYAEVEDNHSPVNVFVLNIDPNDLSPRPQSEVCDDQHLPPNSFPIILGTGVAAEGRIQIAPDLSLIHVIPTVNGAPAFTSYKVTRQ